MCRRRDSNPHAFRRAILSRLCLPFHHSGVLFGYTWSARSLGRLFLPLLSPLWLSLREWQFGHRIMRFSNLLSSVSPLIWCISRGSLPSGARLAQPHSTQYIGFSPSLHNFNLSWYIFVLV